MNQKLISGHALAILGAAWLSAASAQAQSLGSRASGMGQAFVAVADDASSVYWNPAGMATGAYISFVVDIGVGDADSRGSRGHEGASSNNAQLLAFTLPPLGVGYYRLSNVVAGPDEAAGMAGPSREEGRRTVQGLTTSHLGVTLAQSLNQYLVVAGTVKVVRGEVTRGQVNLADASDALDAAEGLPSRGTSRGDVDAGVMLAVEQWRVGLVARNLTTPSFDAPDEGAPVELDREARVGAAWGSGWPGLSRVVVSADADLTRQASWTGERRDIAAGVETWWLGQRLGVRGGVRGSTVGTARPVVATGVSAALAPGFYVEAHLAGGDQDGRSWSVGARYTF
jgi:hypothetical protein